MSKAFYSCDACHKSVDRLFQSYKDGRWHCASCSLKDTMSDEQRRRIELYIKRQAQAVKNFAVGTSG